MRVIESTDRTNEKNEPILDRAMVKERFAQHQHVPYTWGRDASAEDLEWAADELLAAEDDWQIVSYLRQIFWERDFPKSAASLIHLTNSQNERVARAAVRALSRIGDPDVRRLALELMSSVRRTADGILLLKSNWQPGDFFTIEKALATVGEDEFEYHHLGFSILDVLDHAPVPPSESNDTLFKLYENDPCSTCREQVVSKLFASGNVPDWMAEECLYDAAPEIAARFNGAVRKFV
jgi:HEAT repeat protein